MTSSDNEVDFNGSDIVDPDYELTSDSLPSDEDLKRNLQCIKPKRETNVLVQRPGKRITKEETMCRRRVCWKRRQKCSPQKFETTMLLQKEVPRSDT
ncbi:hypothetical protein C0J52_23010 [Blattella germanica]|nr:hypothetical protein C0J52_23010 [Blattella germanica]